MIRSKQDDVLIDDTHQRRWYREPMLWLVVGIPLTAVVVGMMFLTAAIVTWDGLVVDDYYKKGKEINQLIERDQRATALGLKATLKYDHNAGLLTAAMTTGNHSSVLSDNAVVVRYVHRTRSGRDEKFVLERVADNVYVGYAAPPQEGLWSIQVDAPTWRLGTRVQLPVTGGVALRSAQSL